MRAFILTLVLSCSWPSLAQAQGIEVGELAQAQAFEPGTLSSVDGGLDSGLWNGTQAETAISLIEATPDYHFNPVARNLVRSVLLSAGVPPEGDTNNKFTSARMNGIIRLSEMSAAQDIVQRSPGLSSSNVLRADLALLAGNVEAACQQSDSVIEGRIDPFWMKLRAYCHVERGETAAADLTMDLLANSGHEDVYVQRLIRHMTGVPGTPDVRGMPHSPLHIALMNQTGLDWPAGEKPAIAAAQSVYNVTLDPDTRLIALFEAAPALSDTQIQEVLTSFTSEPEFNNLAGGMAGVPTTPSLDLARGHKGAKGFAQLFQLSQFGGAESHSALIELLKRAETASVFPRFTEFLGPQLSTFNYNGLPQDAVPMMTRAAILRQDLGALQQIYQTLDGNEKAQDRVALAADALGNGFFAGNLGTDIDTRLLAPSEKQQALRDALLAYGLGANLSPAATRVLDDKASLGRMSGSLLALESAARRRAQAETALRSVTILESYRKDKIPDFILYKVVESLYQAGLTEQAAQLAALDFISGLNE